MQCVSTRAPAGKSSTACSPIARQRSTSSAWMRSARSRVGSSRIASSAQRRLTAVGRDAASISDAASRSVPALGGERHPVGGRDADRRRAAHGEHADRLGELGAVAQRRSTSSSGSRRWSRTTTASSSSRTIRCGSSSGMRRGETSPAPTVAACFRCPTMEFGHQAPARSLRPSSRGSSPAPPSARRSRRPSSRA